MMSNKKQNSNEIDEKKKSVELDENGKDILAQAIDECEQDEQLEETPVEEMSETDRLTAEIDTLKAKNNKLNNDYLLLMAEFDNYRKRTLREKADLLKSGGEECLKSILTVIDDFERGLAIINESSDIEAVKEGMKLIYTKFEKFLEKHGVKVIITENADFDTELHEAITVFPAPSPELKGKVVDCIQKGYKMNDKVIRFAKVVVGE